MKFTPPFKPMAVLGAPTVEWRLGPIHNGARQIQSRSLPDGPWKDRAPDDALLEVLHQTETGKWMEKHLNEAKCLTSELGLIDAQQRLRACRDGLVS